MLGTGGDGGTFPAMPLAQWIDSKETLHRWLQIVGKIRLAVAPPRNPLVACARSRDRPRHHDAADG